MWWVEVGVQVIWGHEGCNRERYVGGIDMANKIGKVYVLSRLSYWKFGG